MGGVSPADRLSRHRIFLTAGSAIGSSSTVMNKCKNANVLVTDGNTDIGAEIGWWGTGSANVSLPRTPLKSHEQSKGTQITRWQVERPAYTR
jgi:hypothetical protein